MLIGLGKMVKKVSSSLNLLASRVLGYTFIPSGASYYTTTVGSSGPGVMLMNANGVVATSSDFENFNISTPFGEHYISGKGITYFDGKYLSPVWLEGQDFKYAYSTDGDTWVTKNFSVDNPGLGSLNNSAFWDASNTDIHFIKTSFDNNLYIYGKRFIIFDNYQNPVSSGQQVLKSSDGITWSVFDTNNTLGGRINPLLFRGVLSEGNNQLVGRLDDSNDFVYTSDMINWYPVSLPSPGTYDWGADDYWVNAVFNGSRWSFVSQGGKTAISPYLNDTFAITTYYDENNNAINYLPGTNLSSNRVLDIFRVPYGSAYLITENGAMFQLKEETSDIFERINLSYNFTGSQYGSTPYGDLGEYITYVTARNGLGETYIWLTYRSTLDFQNDYQYPLTPSIINGIGYFSKIIPTGINNKLALLSSDKLIFIDASDRLNIVPQGELLPLANGTNWANSIGGPISTLREVQISIGDSGSGGAETLAPVDVYVVPSNKTANIDHITVKNTSTNSITYDFAVLDSGISLTDQNASINDDTIMAGATETINLVTSNLTAGQRIVILPSSVDVVEVKVYGTES